MTLSVTKWNETELFLTQLHCANTLMRQVFEEQNIGPEIVPWMISEGQQVFFGKLREVASEFLVAQRLRVINRNTILVNLDAPPTLDPFYQCEVKENACGGWVTLTKRRGNLYINGSKVSLYAHPSQLESPGVIEGHRLREILIGKHVLHPNLLEALIAFPHMVASDWKQGESGPPLLIYFWGVIYGDPPGRLYVRCGSWRGKKCETHYLNLDKVWRSDMLAAVRQNALAT